MNEFAQLPHLLELLDDESPRVRQAIEDELLRLGSEAISDELGRNPQLLEPGRQRLLSRALGAAQRRRLSASWGEWQKLRGDHVRLESALSLLSDFLDDGSRTEQLTPLLDQCAEEYVERHGPGDVRQLSLFLFQERGLWGDSDEYYRPENSSPVHVLREGRGLPISLACIYMLVGDRIGVEISGCNYPGHFLARVFHEGQIRLVDCFRGGFFVDEDVLVRQNPGAAGMIRKLIRQEVSAELVIDRTLRNLVHAFAKAERAEDRALMERLLRELPRPDRGDECGANALFARFDLGELVQHRRYGYRGVVVARDDSCAADDEWYYSNQTQPAREQPWYHVLVDGSDRITYAAETSLADDPSGEPVSHPLVPMFFREFLGGRYERNDQPWPGSA